MNYLTNEHYEAFQRGLQSLPSGPMRDAVKAVLANRPKPVQVLAHTHVLYLVESDDEGDRVTLFGKKDGRWTRLDDDDDDHQPERWLPTEDGYAVRVSENGFRSIYHVRDGKVDQRLKPDGTLNDPRNPAKLDGTWEPLDGESMTNHESTQKGDPQ